jgi:hypothetical protein
MINLCKTSPISHKLARKVTATIATAAVLFGAGSNVQVAAQSITIGGISQFQTMNANGCMSMQQSVGGITQFSSMCPPSGPVTVIQGSFTGGQTISRVTNTNTTQINSSNVSVNSGSIRIGTQTGTSQTNSILSTLIRNGIFSFVNVRSGNWFDPPTAYGFRYGMTGTSLFTQIFDFPTGFNNPFTVMVKDVLLGTNFTAGQSIDFKNYSDQLGGLLVGGVGVSEFSVTELNVDPTNPEAFPIQLGFNTETASFDQEAIEAVPEPLSLFGSFLGAGVMAAMRRWRVASSAAITDKS